MKAFFLATAAAATLLLVAGIAVADPDHAAEKKREIKILTDADSEPTVIDVEADLALGETREYLTDEGKTVTVTRSLDDEVEVAVDGKIISVPLEGGGHHRLIETLVDEEDGDGQRVQKVIVRRLGDEDCEEGQDCGHGEHHVRKVIVTGDDVDGDAEVNVEVLRLAGDDLDCQEGESREDCETRAHGRILELLGDEGVDGDAEVIVIQKRRRVASAEEGEGEGGP